MIKSFDNDKLKYLRKLIKSASYRKEEKTCVVEGIKIINDIDKKLIKKMYISSDLFDKINNDRKFENEILSDLNKDSNLEVVKTEIFNRISQTKTPQGAIALVSILSKDISDIIKNVNTQNDNILILEDIQDPGNMGTIIRTALALGITKILISTGCVDIYNPKVIRATSGAVFKSNIYISDNIVSDFLFLKENGYKIYATTPRDSVDIEDISFENKIGIIIGNEGKGVSDMTLNASDARIGIRISEKIESLNASIAAAIIMYKININNNKR